MHFPCKCEAAQLIPQHISTNIQNSLLSSFLMNIFCWLFASQLIHPCRIEKNYNVTYKKYSNLLKNNIHRWIFCKTFSVYCKLDFKKYNCTDIYRISIWYEVYFSHFHFQNPQVTIYGDKLSFSNCTPSKQKRKAHILWGMVLTTARKVITA